MMIEKASHEHIPAICALYGELFSDMPAQQPSYYRAGFIKESAVGSFIDRADEGVVLVALEQEEVVGFTYVMRQKTPAYGPFLFKKYGLLSDIAVKKAHRGKGIGTGLLHAAKEWAVSNGMDYLELHVLPENAQAERLYKREGFHPVMHVMRYDL